MPNRAKNFCDDISLLLVLFSSFSLFYCCFWIGIVVVLLFFSFRVFYTDNFSIDFFPVRLWNQYYPCRLPSSQKTIGVRLLHLLFKRFFIYILLLGILMQGLKFGRIRGCCIFVVFLIFSTVSDSVISCYFLSPDLCCFVLYILLLCFLLVKTFFNHQSTIWHLPELFLVCSFILRSCCVVLHSQFL